MERERNKAGEEKMKSEVDGERDVACVCVGWVGIGVEKVEVSLMGNICWLSLGGTCPEPLVNTAWQLVMAELRERVE